jgi:hypothetical protein
LRLLTGTHYLDNLALINTIFSHQTLLDMWQDHFEPLFYTKKPYRFDPKAYLGTIASVLDRRDPVI